MQEVRSFTAGVPRRNRLAIKLALLFAATFLTVLLVAVLYELLASTGVSADAVTEVQPAPITIDPKIQRDLAQVMAFDAIPGESDIKDPFFDRGGLSAAAKTSAALAGQKSAPSTAVAAGGTSAAGAQTSGGGARTGTNAPGGSIQDVTSVDATRARYDNWSKSDIASQNERSVSEILLIDDLVPVGFASGGSGSDEVMLYSNALCRTFSFGVGTRFMDGWLNALSPFEAVFATNSTYRHKSFRRPEACATTASSPGDRQQSTDQRGARE